MAHKNKKWISQKIKKMMKEDPRHKKRSHKQMVAIAFSMARAKHKRK